MFQYPMHVSIHVPLAEHDRPSYFLPEADQVSIHVPLAEHDVLVSDGLLGFIVSIHVPLAEHDQRTAFLKLDVRGFNSRAPRGARRPLRGKVKGKGSFNSRAPRGARPPRRWQCRGKSGFNSRAPRGARRFPLFLSR